MVILVDSTNQPLDSLDSVELLQESGVREELASSGLEVMAIVAQETGPRPQEPDDNKQGISYVHLDFCGKGFSE